MTVLLNVLIFLIAYLFDTAKAFGFISVFGIMPDMVFVALLCFCMFYQKERGLVLAVLLGFITDMVTTSPFGAHALIYVIASAVIGIIYETVFERNIWTALVSVFFVGLGYNIITYIFQVFLMGEYSFWYVLCRYILPGCAFNVIITPVFYWLVGKVYYRNERIF